MPPDGGSTELELRDYLRVLRRRKSTILVVTGAAIGTALAISYLQTPVYRATAEVLVQPRASEEIFSPDSDRAIDAERAVETEKKVIESRTVRDAVREELGRDPDVSASVVADTDLIAVSVE